MPARIKFLTLVTVSCHSRLLHSHCHIPLATASSTVPITAPSQQRLSNPLVLLRPLGRASATAVATQPVLQPPTHANTCCRPLKTLSWRSAPGRAHLNETREGSPLNRCWKMSRQDGSHTITTSRTCTVQWGGVESPPSTTFVTYPTSHLERAGVKAGVLSHSNEAPCLLCC